MSSERAVTIGSSATFVALAAVMTACVTVATMVFVVYIPATGGYFNVGESVVYISALLFGPEVGAFSGGVGSMLSDVLYGYSQFAPGTLVIKGLEGFIVGIISRRIVLSRLKGRTRQLSALVGLSVGAYLTIMGLAGVIIQWSFGAFVIPPFYWLIVSAVSALIVAYTVYRTGVGGMISVLSMLVGGVLMVTGYFLYEQLILGTAAIAEVFPNFMQCLIGIVIALPVYHRVRKAISL